MNLNDDFKEEFEEHCERNGIDLTGMSGEYIEAYMVEYVKKKYGSRASIEYDEDGNLIARIMPPLV